MDAAEVRQKRERADALESEARKLRLEANELERLADPPSFREVVWPRCVIGRTCR